MIDLTLSSDEEEVRSPKRPRVHAEPGPLAERVGIRSQAPAQTAAGQAGDAAAVAPVAAAAAARPPATADACGDDHGLGVRERTGAAGVWETGTRSAGAAGPGPGSAALAAAAATYDSARGLLGQRSAGLGDDGDDEDGDWEPENDHERRLLAGVAAGAGLGSVAAGAAAAAAGDSGCGAAGGGGSGGRGWGDEDADDDWLDAEAEAEVEGAAGGGGKKKVGAGAGARKRLTAEERERAKAEKAEEKERARAAKAAERERAKAAKEAEKEAKKAAKEATKRAKEADKEDRRNQKEVDNALKATMVPRYLRLLLSNSLAAHPLGMAMQAHAPVAREGRHETFDVEVHREMPLAAAGYRYCMWGMRVPAGAAERLAAAAAAGGSEGCCALEPCSLPDVADTGKSLLLFPLLALVLLGDELLRHLEADAAFAALPGVEPPRPARAGPAPEPRLPGAAGGGWVPAAGGGRAAPAAAGPRGPLSRLYSDVAAAHPGASLLVYVVGLGEALTRRQRANKAFNREAVEDLLFDITVGMPAVRLHTDCPDGDWAHAATFLVNYGWALAGAPRKRQAAQPGYLNNFGNKSTLPLRVIKDVLRDRAAAAAAAAATAAGGGAAVPADEADDAEAADASAVVEAAEEGALRALVPALVLCDALSHLVVPASAAAVAAEYGSLGALIEALKARPEGKLRERLLANCPIPGAVPGKQRLTRAGPAAAASLARFLTTHNGREVWADAADVE
ncbi:hypothetical protein HYH02_009415 [Chlamydomonas schloesseri]|uniref:Uncharacterized protein n=1 Tax=Chlamydomonas schloesseri TaxID=2026947 RepID=A0A835TLU6_9CHLO|nr:hypothetical protein HYH02_009415 [Chlamydomonas schloesseri]|eukprot:KAG2442999.1 hypothetical protein HYH02_009415 [Chlamydomonas schloesseri]